MEQINKTQREIAEELENTRKRIDERTRDLFAELRLLYIGTTEGQNRDVRACLDDNKL